MKPLHSLYTSALGMVFALSCAASELNITAEFKPTSTQPVTTQFTNTTPMSGYCAQFNHHCNPGEFTITFPLTIHREWKIPDVQQAHGYQRVDGDWKTVSISRGDGAAPVALRMRLNLLSRTYELGQLQPGGIGGGTIGWIGNLSGRYGAQVGGCKGRMGVGNSQMYMFAWSVPQGITVCSRPLSTDAQPMGPYAGTLSEISIGYELVAPDPMKLVNGTYTGSVTYSVGEGRQIDLGTGTYDQAEVTFNFELTVEHQLRIDMPPGSERALLTPPNGWADWLHRSKPPTRLQRDNPLQIWAAVPLRVYVRCQYPQGNACAIREPRSGDEVPLSVAISLPAGIEHNGRPVNRLELPTSEPAALQFASVRPAYGQYGKLHYAVEQPSVAQMLTKGGSTYTGGVTIIFDAQI